MKTQDNNTIRTILKLHQLWLENKTTENAKNILEALSFYRANMVATPTTNGINYEVELKEIKKDFIDETIIEFYVKGPVEYSTKREVYSSEELERLEATTLQDIESI
jgi:hypothetical protein